MNNEMSKVFTRRVYYLVQEEDYSYRVKLFKGYSNVIIYKRSLHHIALLLSRFLFFMLELFEQLLWISSLITLQFCLLRSTFLCYYYEKHTNKKCLIQ